ncbi:MAG: 16S rRNA (guanine(527)-N(7))-methyltransferase RsmG [Nitrospiria bacterium]
MPRIEAKSLLISGSERLGLPLSPLQVDQFLTYLSELIRWNRKINLTGLRHEDDIVIKLFLDALTPLVIREIHGDLKWRDLKWIDVGTGAGSPGLALKIVRPELQMTLVEPAEKKVAFLHHIIGTLGLSRVSVAQGRVESLKGPKWEGTFDLLLTRGLDPRFVMKKGTPLVRDGGRILFYQANAVRGAWENRLEEYPELVLDAIRPVSLPFIADPRHLILLKVFR